MSDPNQIKLGKVTLNTSDAESIPTLQLTYLGKVANAALLLPYGVTSRPPKDTLCLVINIGGQEENRIAIPLGTAKRKKGLKDGETVLENQVTGSFLYMREDGTLEVNIPENLQTTVKAIAINAAGAVSVVATGNATIETPKLIVTSPETETSGSAKIGTGFGCNGASPQGSAALPDPATNLATVIILANAMRAALIANGIGS